MVLFLSSVSAFCICDSQVGRGKEHSLQSGCELPSPAMQTLPLGCPPHTANAPRRLPTYGAGGRTRWALRQERHLTTTVLQDAGGLYSRVTRKYKLHNTAGLQIVKHYKTRNVSTTIQHVFKDKIYILDIIYVFYHILSKVCRGDSSIQ